MILLVDRNNKVDVQKACDAIEEARLEGYKIGYADAVNQVKPMIEGAFDELMKRVKEMLE